MNDIELNAILYYADFLSLKTLSKPISNTCKYFFIHGTPLNATYIATGILPYEEDNPFFLQARKEYETLKNKFGLEGVESFLEDISYLRARGAVDAKQMLRCIHQYSTKIERKQAFTSYYRWLDEQKYTHIVLDDDGKEVEKECSKYVLHFEASINR